MYPINKGTSFSSCIYLKTVAIQTSNHINLFCHVQSFEHTECSHFFPLLFAFRGIQMYDYVTVPL